MRKNIEPENWTLKKLKTRIEEIYKELRSLAVSLLDLNIKQYDGTILRTDAYTSLYELANKQIDLENELFNLERIVEERESVRAKINS